MIKRIKKDFLFSVKEGVFRQFKGSRATKDFLDFIEEKQWEKLEAVTGMSDPAGLPMGVLGFFFKLSYAMKDLHKVMTEDYKFSTWISYAFFTLVTILVGGLLGLVRILSASLSCSHFYIFVFFFLDGKNIILTRCELCENVFKMQKRIK